MTRKQRGAGVSPGIEQFSKEVEHAELIDLDNEFKLLKKKSQYLQAKLYKETTHERDQNNQIRKLKDQVTAAQQKEEEIIEYGQKMFKIDFGDPTKQLKLEEQKELHA